jgi:curved DNA-binding protein CbpA
MVNLKDIFVRSILQEALSVSDAIDIFQSYGVSVQSLTPEKLKKKYQELIVRHHPDKGGNVEDAKMINAAYDALKKNDINTNRRNDNDINVNRKYGSAEFGSRSHEPWRWAGYSGGSPPQDSTGPYMSAGWIKKKAWEISGKPKATSKNEYSFYTWDGYSFRDSITTYAKPETLYIISEMISAWSSSNHIKAVFYVQKWNPNRLYLINHDKTEISPSIEMTFGGINQNPSNDRSFVDYLIDNLSTIVNNRVHETVNTTQSIKNILQEVKLLLEMSFGGEWWITDSGNAMFADGDIGDMNHSAYVIDMVSREILDMFDVYCDDHCNLEDQIGDIYDEIKDELSNEQIKRWEDESYDVMAEYLNLDGNELKKFKMKIDVCFDIIDPRDYCMEHMGWMRVINNNIQVWELNNSILKNISYGLYDAYPGELDDNEMLPEDKQVTFTIESMKTKTLYYDVPYSVIESGNVSKLNAYRHRYGENR